MKKTTITMKSEHCYSIDDCFQMFIKHCLVKNLSSRTIKYYQDNYHRFQNYVNISDPITSITAATIEDYILALKREDTRNEITINSYLRSARAFLYWCMKNDYLTKFTIPLLKTEKKIKETYNNYELSLLLKEPNKKKCSFTEYKMWAFVNFLLGTGMRISSALNIKIKDVDFDSGSIIITKTKNRTQQIIPLSNTLANVLHEYLNVRGSKPDDYLFCNLYGEKGNVRSFEDNLQCYNHSRGVTKTSAHLFRHTFAKNWILNGGDIFRLQKILGHSDLTVVRNYVNMFSNEVAVNFDKFNPLDSMIHKNHTIKMK